MEKKNENLNKDFKYLKFMNKNITSEKEYFAKNFD